jgi:hypothetical protein
VLSETNLGLKMSDPPSAPSASNILIDEQSQETSESPEAPVASGEGHEARSNSEEQEESDETEYVITVQLVTIC